MEQPVFMLDYDEVADYVFANLIDLGYAPTSDEVLDVADIMYDFVIQLHLAMGGEVEIMDELEEGEDE